MKSPRSRWSFVRRSSFLGRQALDTVCAHLASSDVTKRLSAASTSADDNGHVARQFDMRASISRSGALDQGLGIRD
jgi:hypothetical protein